MKKLNKIHAIIFLLAIFSCSELDQQLKVTELDSSKLVDGQPHLGELLNISFNDQNNFATYDNQNNIKIFENFEFVKLIGNFGNGPCEYRSLNNIKFSGDKVKAIDRENSKYIIYDRNDEFQECTELVFDSIPRIMSLEDISKTTYLIKGTLSEGTDENSNLIYKYNPEQSDDIIPLDITLSDVDVRLPNFPIRLSIASTVVDGKIALYYPLNKNILLIDPSSNSISYVETDIFLGEDGSVHAEKDMMVLMEKINNEIEVVFDLFTISNDVIAVSYRKGVDLENQYWGIKLYSLDGTKAGEYNFDERIVQMNNNLILELKVEPNNMNKPYTITKYAFE